MTVRNGKLLSKTVLISALFLCSCIHEEIPEDENFIVPLKYTQETDNEKIKAMVPLVRETGIEPVRPHRAQDFKSCASACSATRAKQITRFILPFYA